MLTKEQILNAQDVAKEKLSVPEWGGDIYIKSLSVAETEAIANLMRDDKVKDSSFLAVWMAACICDSKGEPLFTMEDAPALAKKSKSAAERIMNKISEVNGLGSFEEIAKN